MKDRTSAMLNNEVLKVLESMKYMEPGTGDYQAALEDLKTLRAIMEECNDRKFDKLIKIATLIIEGGKIVAMVGSVIICVLADQKGWFVSKLGLGVISKPRL